MNSFANPNFEFRMTPRRLLLVRRIDDQKFLGAFEHLSDLEKCLTLSDKTADSRKRLVELLASFPPIHRREKPCHQQRRLASEREWRQRERVFQQLWDLSTPCSAENNYCQQTKNVV
jgi:hypothetical protein